MVAGNWCLLKEYTQTVVAPPRGCTPSPGTLLMCTSLASCFETKQEDKSQPRPSIFGSQHNTTTGLCQLRGTWRRWRGVVTVATHQGQPQSMEMCKRHHFPKPYARQLSLSAAVPLLCPRTSQRGWRGPHLLLGPRLPDRGAQAHAPVRDSSLGLLPATVKTFAHLLFKFKVQQLFFVPWYCLGPQLRSELALFKPDRFFI